MSEENKTVELKEEDLNKKLTELKEDDLVRVNGGGGIVTCNTCNGTGYINNTPCRYCRGSGGIYDPNYVAPAPPNVEINIGNLEELVKDYLKENGL